MILRFRHDHAVDHLDDAVRCLDVGLRESGIVHLYGVAAGVDLHGTALDGLGVRRPALEGVSRERHGHDMAGQDLLKLGPVLRLHAILDRPGRKPLEGLVGKRNDRVGTFALERPDEPGSLLGHRQRLEAAVGVGGSLSDGPPLPLEIPKQACR